MQRNLSIDSSSIQFSFYVEWYTDSADSSVNIWFES